MIINHNISSMNALRNLSLTARGMDKSMEKLSSGYRINRAADDAAGLAISERMRAQIGGLKMAQRNAQDGISLIQTAEGALDEVHEMLRRMRDLAVQADNGTNDATDQAKIQSEIDALVSEIDGIASRTKFNGTALLNNTNSVSFQIGANAGENITVAFQDMTAATLTVDATDVATQAETDIASIDTAINTVSDYRSNLGAVQNRLEHTIDNLAVTTENLQAAESRVRDTDMAAEMSNLTKNQILQQAGTAMLAQANMKSQSVLSLLG